MKSGLLIINLGTPSSPKIGPVWTYLRHFLMDRRIIDLPKLYRYFLVYFVILPFRTHKSSSAYKSIWTKQGSPLLIHSTRLVSQLQKASTSNYLIALGMRYGSPSIKSALDQLKECSSITVLPLYPQYSSAATGSSIEHVMHLLNDQEVWPRLTVIRDFYQQPEYIKAQAQLIKEHLIEGSYLLFSYHGIPERQIRKSGCHQVCADACPRISATNQGCYKAQCHQTTCFLASELKLKSNQYSTSFQSRIGKTSWIKPFTDEMLLELSAKGIKNLSIVCPSFVADCLETLEEIGIQAKEQWMKLGGEQFTLIPSLNDKPEWVKAIMEIIR